MYVLKKSNTNSKNVIYITSELFRILKAHTKHGEVKYFLIILVNWILLLLSFVTVIIIERNVKKHTTK